MTCFKDQLTVSLWAVLGLSCALLMGCAPKGVDRIDLGEATTGPKWELTTTAMRIYPSTRFVKTQGVPLLEARVQLFDSMGDAIKSSGVVRFELLADGRGSGSGDGRLLYSWDIELATLDDQKRYYDPVTLGYLFRLQIEDTGIVHRQIRLRATFQLDDGQRFTDEQPVRTNW